MLDKFIVIKNIAAGVCEFFFPKDVLSDKCMNVTVVGDLHLHNDGNILHESVNCSSSCEV